MGEQTKIQWADHTFNSHIGCACAKIPGTDKPHPGCLHCYAREYGKRFGVAWGPNGTRRRTSDANWREPLAWDQKAAEGQCPNCTGSKRRNKVHESGYGYAVCERCGGTRNIGPHRRRAFLSLCDPFEEWQGPIVDSNGVELHCLRGVVGRASAFTVETPLATMNDLRRDLFAMIDATPNLDWLLLTKRPENIRPMLVGLGPTGEYKIGRRCAGPAYYRPNVWLLYSASDQESFDAGVPYLLKCRDLSPVLGVSFEPLLERVTIPPALLAQLDLAIFGGESGRDARPCDISDIRFGVQQFQAAGLPVYLKQVGQTVLDKHAGCHLASIPGWPNGTTFIAHSNKKPWWPCGVRLKHPKGGDPSEWPKDLQDCREFPVVKGASDV